VSASAGDNISNAKLWSRSRDTQMEINLCLECALPSCQMNHWQCALRQHRVQGRREPIHDRAPSCREAPWD
jgi:hypothetical protein